MNLSDKAVSQLEQLQKALDAEFSHEKKEAVEALEHNTVQALVQQGKCWFPVMVKRTEYDKAEYLVVEIEQSNEKQSFSSLSAGRKIKVFSTHHSDHAFEGTVLKSGQQFIQIATRMNDEPDWLFDGKIGLFPLQDDFTYSEARKTLRYLLEKPQPRTKKLIELFYGEEQLETRFKNVPLAGTEDLNPLQVQACTEILQIETVYLLHGPPGTGKTTTLSHAMAHLLEHEKQILFCAHSNTAVDVMTEKLMDLNIDVLRIGNPVKISPLTLSASLDYQCQHSEHHKLVKELKRKADELHKMAGKYKRVFGQEEREHRKLLFTEAKKMSKEAIELTEQQEKYLIDKAQVICCTPAMSNTGYLRDKKFTTLFFDEATQGTDPVFWIAGIKAEKIVLAGDHQQLGPTVKSDEAKKIGLEKSIFEKGMEKKLPSLMLQTQYRMHEKIMQFSNEKFYSGQLKAHEQNAQHTLNLIDEDWNKPFVFIDTAGSGYDENQSETMSIQNTGEAEFVLKYTQQLLTHCQPNAPQIGIISPYAAQVSLLKELFKENGFIPINTIDGYQGQEKDIIIISCVRSNTDGEIGFLKDIRRMNVALTRARKKLVIVGDSATLGGFGFYTNLLEYAERIDGYKTVWDFNL